MRRSIWTVKSIRCLGAQRPIWRRWIRCLLLNGDSAGLHHRAYDVNDEAIVYGTSYWIELVENTLVS